MILVPSSNRRAAILFLVRHTSRLPRGVADQVFGAAGIAAAVAEPRRLALSYAWAAAHEPSTARRWRSLLSVLAHRGRVFVDHWAPVFEEPAELRDRVRLEGRQYLDAVAGRSSILLGFHVGVPITGWALSAHGYHCVVAGDDHWHFAGRAAAQPGWSESDTNDRVLFPSDEQGMPNRAVALHRLRALLLAGGTVRMIGDGTSGRELFRITAPIGTLVVRSGWWSLRRQTAATVVPVLAHREGSRAVLTAYPPLPDPITNPEADLEHCRAQLIPLIQHFVLRHPDQCLPWMFDHVASASRTALS